jgi:PAS domain S-box-containing protein
VGQIGSWRLDVQRNVLTWSQENHRIFGIPAGTPLTYEIFLGTVHPDDRQYVDTQWQAGLRGEPYDIEHRLMVDGRVKWVREKAYLEFDDAGSVLGGFGITQDITERKQAEQALRESKEFADKVLSSSLNGIYIYDLEKGVNAFINSSYTRLTGYTLEEINALSKDEFFALFHVEDQPRIAAHMRGIQDASDQEVLEVEYRFKSKSGQWRWYLSRDAVFLRGDDGAVRQFIGTFVDLTERKEAEAKLSDAQQLSAALNRINTMIHASFEPDEIMQHLVSEGAESLGCETAALSARQSEQWIVRHVHGLPDALVGAVMDDDEECHAVLALRGGQPVAIEDAWADERVNRDHMRKHNIRAVLVVPVAVRNQPLGVIFFNYHSAPYAFSEREMDFAKQLAATASIALENVRLLEERKQAEDELKTLNDTLEQQVAERTAVAERRAHDLRRLAGELCDAERRERERLARLLHDDLQQMLVAARLHLPDAGWTDVQAVRTGVEASDALLTKCINAARSLAMELSPPMVERGTLVDLAKWLAEWYQEKYKLNVGLEAEEPLPPVPEHFRAFLFEAVRELLLNVQKHSGAMNARLLLSSQDGYLIVQVEDGGNAFAAESVAEKLDHPRSFGLFTIRERLEALEGRLEFERTPNGGGCFRLIVPVAETKEPTTGPVQTGREAVQRAAAEEQPSVGGLIRLLVVDDNEIVRQGFVSLLEREQGFEIVGQASDGEEAVRQAEALRPDAIIMDIDMPKFNGIEATRQIVAQQPECVVVGLSVHSDEHVARTMAEAGAVACLSKGASVNQLLTAIRCGQQEDSHQ